MVVRGDYIHDDRPGAEGGALRALGRHRLHHPADHHLQPAARAAGGDVDIHTLIAAGGRDDLFAIEDFSAGQLLQLRHGVQHAASDILEGRLDRRGRLAAERLVVPVGLPLDEDGLGRRAAAVGGHDYVEILRVHFLRSLFEALANSISSTRASSPSRRSTMATMRS